MHIVTALLETPFPKVPGPLRFWHLAIAAQGAWHLAIPWHLAIWHLAIIGIGEVDSTRLLTGPLQGGG